jgi:indolepyruvate ferredoxin oxidoreductase
MKMVTNLCDGLATVQVRSERKFVSPVVEINGVPWRHRQRSSVLTPISLEQEAELFGGRLTGTKAHLEAHGINQTVRRSAEDRLGIVSYGKPFTDLIEALDRLGARASLPSIRILKLGASYPLPERTIREFALGLAEVLVIEEKRSFVETQIKEILYASTERPAVLGKLGRDGATLVPAVGELNQERIDKVLRAWLSIPSPARRQEPAPIQVGPAPSSADPVPRRPAAYCSGCPHSRSTLIPEGALSGGGCGCHSLIYVEPRHKQDDLFSVVPMGTEGAEWIGLAPFVDTTHMFQNLGDGTYFHSGVNAVRACIDSGVNMTFKLLFNSAIAMTGGQEVPGDRGVDALTRELEAMGVVRTIVCTDDAPKYRRRKLADNATVLAREDLDRAQTELAAVPGVTVLLFDQYCAAEARRLRKRGAMPTPAARVVINERVCEGCGDCQSKSNCLSVVPVSTDLGRKTQIHDPSCNRDYSCLAGDCPSFVTVVPKHPTRRVKPQAVEPPTVVEPTDRAVVPADPAAAFSLVLAGIGGTGVMTANQILAVAAVIDGYSCVGLDQTGLSQKAGPVLSHLRISRGPAALPGAVSQGAADAYLAFDPIVGVSEPALACLGTSRTKAMVNSDVAPTRDMVVDPSMRDGANVDALVKTIAGACAPGRTITLSAISLSESIFADHMPANLLMVGAAYQAGLIPLASESIRAAITANGVSVQKNLAAFEWGRNAQASPSAQPEAGRLGFMPMSPSPPALAHATRLSAEVELPESLRSQILGFAAELADYGGTKVTRRYLALVSHASRAERDMGAEPAKFSAAVARNFFKVLAYKDEYEVARLLLNKRFHTDLASQVGPATVYYHLHPPLLRMLGLRRKIRIRSTWAVPMFVVLRALRPLRSTLFDPFGYTRIRRRERQFIVDYERSVFEAATWLADAPERALAVAELPETVRGYESIKEAGLDTFYQALQTLNRPSDRLPESAGVAGS